MAGYLAMRIEAGKLDYVAVVTRYPQFKVDIDTILINDGFQDLIVEQFVNKTSLIIERIGGAVGSALVAARCRGFESHPIFLQIRKFYMGYNERYNKKGDV